MKNQTLKKDHRYLLKKCSYSEYGQDIMEVQVLEVFEKAYKLKNLVHSIVFFLEKYEIKTELHNKDGFVIFEEVGPMEPVSVSK